MVLGLGDLRRLGYLKIASVFFTNDEKKQDFTARVALLNSSIDDLRVTPYGYPSKLKKLGLVNNEYVGIKVFTNMIEPMLNDIAVDEVCKRGFRNAYQSLWDSFSEAVDLQQCGTYQTLGIKLAFKQCEDKEIVMFYNAVMLWGVLTRSENTILDYYGSVEDLLQDLVCFSNVFFVDNLICRFRKKG